MCWRHADNVAPATTGYNRLTIFDDKVKFEA